MVGTVLRRRVVAVLSLALAALAISVLAAGALGGNARSIVKTARNKALGKTILVDRGGMTLYHLSAEKHGKFICTNSSCLAFWHPLVLAPGKKATGVRFLGSVKRPDGRLQVTYRGGPLYTFVQDRKPGDIKGNGFKDVGVWHPVALGAGTAGAPTAQSNGSSYGGYGRG